MAVNKPNKRNREPDDDDDDAYGDVDGTHDVSEKKVKSEPVGEPGIKMKKRRNRGPNSARRACVACKVSYDLQFSPPVEHLSSLHT